MSRPTDAAIDLETLGKDFDAPIVSIGAAAFDRNTGKVGPTFYKAIDLHDALHYGRVDADTLRWWMKQMQKNPGSGIHFFDGNAVSMRDGLMQLADFIRALPANLCVWGNGPSFDITILERTYLIAGQGLAAPWHFKHVRDMRTVVDMSGVDTYSIPFTGTPHHALDDAVHEAKVISEGLMQVARWRKQSAGEPVPQPATQEPEEW
jgi:exodeoxyribonuclease VIII